MASQQSPRTHWLHGVPPGSSAQVPPSARGAPHRPSSQVSPMQHGVGAPQFEPLSKHAPDPQTFDVHSSVQHSAALVHENPSSLHSFVLHTLFSHTAPQQSEGVTHSDPSGEQL